VADYDVEIEDFPFPVAAVEVPAVPIELVAVDTVAPELTIISPPAGSQIFSNAAVTFDVTDDRGLQDVMAWVEHAGAWEVIWGGDAAGFSPAYEDGSTRTAISGGFRFVVQRLGGWQSSPTFHALVFDQAGNQV
jgi:hypothetical protein